MAEVIRMPRLSDTMEEGVIVGWTKKVGDSVAPGDVLAEVETDKATMDLESFVDGTLLHIAVEEGGVPVDGLIAIIGDANDDVEAILAGIGTDDTPSPTPIPEEAPSPSAPSPSAPAHDNSTSIPSKDERVKASPLARKMAKDAGLDIQGIQGSGTQGRIIKRDVEAAIAQPSPTSPTAYPSSGHEDITVSQMRKTIARRLGESKFQAPHFYLTMKVDMTDTMAARKQINSMIAPDKVSFNDIIVKCVAHALKKHPAVNSSWHGDFIRKNYDVHIGVAVAVDDGLLVPVIRHTDQKSLTQISSEVVDMAGRARERRLGLDEMQGNTFTISNLGMFGIEEFTAIINPPDACILAIGGIEATPVVIDGEIKVRNIMKLTLSCDHRVVDGATGSKFLQTVKQYLEAPIRILA